MLNNMEITVRMTAEIYDEFRAYQRDKKNVHDEAQEKLAALRIKYDALTDMVRDGLMLVQPDRSEPPYATIIDKQRAAEALEAASNRWR